MTPWMGESRKALRIKIWAEVHAVLAPDDKAPQIPGEIARKKVEAEKLEVVGRLPQLSPTQQLAQMVVEAGPTMSGGEELARRKL